MAMHGAVQGAIDRNQVRPAALSGTFYPADASALADMVDNCLETAPSHDLVPKAIIAPHAGFVYSGPIAGTAYKSIAGRRNSIRRVVILGPCHRVPVRGFAVPSSQAFATPLGTVPVDHQAIDSILKLPGVAVNDAAHKDEHCLETQLPFLQHLLTDFTIVPIIVGTAERDAVGRVLAKLWGGEETLVVISSDLTHFLDYDTAHEIDLAACRTIEALEPDKLTDDQACGRHSIKGLISRAQALDLRVTTLDLRNSGDTAGKIQRNRVVGYGALAFEDAATARLSDNHRGQLLQSAVRSLAIGLKQGKMPKVATDSFPRPLQAMRASFVTLKIDGKLRGCVGSLKAHQPLITDVATNTIKAAFHDRRFQPMTNDEVQALDKGMEISVSILSHPRPLAFGSEAEAQRVMTPGLDGIMLRDGNHNSLFLPQVWESLSEPDIFLAELKRKAGLPKDHWSDTMELHHFRSETFGSRVNAG